MYEVLLSQKQIWQEKRKIQDWKTVENDNGNKELNR